ncbi:hypothetical protein DES37_112128 [Mangrovibacter plantisponsor]|uniref:Uncharacterized protein n=1 Tax=Mangrovibacter plantisponsor TaxID=451513 RepID=A0A317PVN4_9ENTR|nr:hypothetical protein DES37_112128 [Mangrovibacter plantisponsor]
MEFISMLMNICQKTAFAEKSGDMNKKKKAPLQGVGPKSTY